LLREEEFEHSSMRKASGRAWAVCEASPSKNEQPLTFVLRAPSRFFLQFTFSEMRIMIRAHSQPAEWLPVSIAPSDADLEVCVMDYDGIVHALEFPCHQDKTGWFDVSTKKHIDIEPTHWRTWAKDQ
jgi:hypothetical protein